MHTRDKSVYFPWQLLGAGLLLAWSFLTFLSGQAKVVSLSSSWPDMAYLCTTLITVIALAALEHFTGRLQSRGGLLVTARLGCALMCIGMVFSAAYTLGSSHAFPLLLVGKVLAGPGQGLLWFSWGVVLSRFEMEEVEHAFMSWILVLAAAMLAPTILGMLSDWLQGIFFLVVMVGLPIASLVIFEQSLNMVHIPGSDYVSRAAAPQKNASKAGAPASASAMPAAQDGLKAVALTFANMAVALAAIIFIWSAFLYEHNIELEEIAIVFAGGAVISFFAIWGSLRATRKFRLHTFYRWMVPLVTVAIVIDVALGRAFLIPAFICLTVANVCFEAMSRLYIVHTAIRHSSSSAFLVAMGLVATTLAGIVGAGLWTCCLMTGAASFSRELLMAMLCVFVITASLSSDQDSPDLSDKEAQDAHTQALAEQRDDVSEKEAFTVMCDAVSERYGLSRRERDVLALLAQGRSRTYIREALFISKGTVDTHIHHIYSKMGVRSKDEVQSIVLGEGESQ